MPFIANTLADRQIFMSQRIFKETLALAEQANFYLATLGPCDEHSLLFRHRYLSGLELQDLKRAGAVCDCIDIPIGASLGTALNRHQTEIVRNGAISGELQDVVLRLPQE